MKVTTAYEVEVHGWDMRGRNGPSSTYELEVDGRDTPERRAEVMSAAIAFTREKGLLRDALGASATIQAAQEYVDDVPVRDEADHELARWADDGGPAHD